MKKIGFITKNKVLAQSLASFIKNNPELPFEPLVLLNIKQAAMDAEILRIDVAVVEMTAGNKVEAETILSLCEQLRKMDAKCQILLLVPQDNKEGRNMAMKAVNAKTVDDYVFLDTSLDYLFAKLLAL